MENKKESININYDSLPQYLFHQGTNCKAYEFLGCNVNEDKISFRVWAPNADKVFLVGDKFDWENGKEMKKITDKGIWEIILPYSEDMQGSFYKYKIINGEKTLLKADPYAYMNETLGKTASIIFDIKGFKWEDEKWLNYRNKLFLSRTKEKHFYPNPMNIYEVHLSSWKTKNGLSTENGENYLPYREIADELIPYVKEMGYTHVELMPIAEHPFDGSWGYQVCGYYSPTSRFGNPHDFMYLVNEIHKAGLGIILDWVPAHFPKDAYGLYEFDGQPLYEYQGSDRQEHKSWGTRCFDVGREEVQSFLISNAEFWLNEYHIDGLRIDAVASMLYLDYDRKPGEWTPNTDGDNKNKEAIAFFQKLNTSIFERHPDILMIAEESTAWPMVTRPVSEGGLGFNFKWNMGWANDMFEYIATDPLFRKYQHNKLTFPMMYMYSENFILPVSHDEVVHGKKSLIDKMFGEYEDKFGCDRVFMAYMMTLPGKKLNFMGNEFAQFREWDFANQLEWFMLDYPKHSEFKQYCKDLNNFYLKHKQLWEIDDSWKGFEWVEAEQAEMNTLAYKRMGNSGKELYIVLNFSPVERKNYTLKVSKRGSYKEVFNSDLYEYGGKNKKNKKSLKSYKKEKDNIIDILLPAYGALIFEKEK